MPRFTKQTVSIKEIIKKLHNAISYKDLDTILTMWLLEEQISYIGFDGSCAKGTNAIKHAFAKIIDKISYIEILNIETHTLIGCIFVETLEAIKYDSESNQADCYLHATYVLVQNRDGWRFLRMHFSIASDDSVSYDNCLQEKSTTGLH